MALPLDESPWRNDWAMRSDVAYLNHGSFGPAPRLVVQERKRWIDELEAEPMDFYLRRFEPELARARARLAGFVGATPDRLCFVDNATFGMNIVAASFELGPGDEVLATDHEYGAVLRIWRERCRRSGARLAVARLPLPLQAADQVVDAILCEATPRTRIIVVSHVTSPTAAVLPVEAICQEARRRGIAVCIDGPHAPAATPLAIDRLECDFYTASCHKWMCAPFGSGFLYVHPRWHTRLLPVVVSWGNSLGGREPNWVDEYNWLGTRDPSAFLAVPAAIDYLESLAIPEAASAANASDEVQQYAADRAADHRPAEALRGLALFRQRSHALAQFARQKLCARTGLEPMIPDSEQWYGPMIALPLPDSVGEPNQNHWHPLQQEIWQRHHIEVPIVNWHGRRYVRVSCHMYNTRADIDRLDAALEELL
jgi:isopenicillin-N epimerase